jgi:hypothetical protein
MTTHHCPAEANGQTGKRAKSPAGQSRGTANNPLLLRGSLPVWPCARGGGHGGASW